jgi:hypothetical protein
MWNLLAIVDKCIFIPEVVATRLQDIVRKRTEVNSPETRGEDDRRLCMQMGGEINVQSNCSVKDQAASIIIMLTLPLVKASTQQDRVAEPNVDCVEPDSCAVRRLYAYGIHRVRLDGYVSRGTGTTEGQLSTGCRNVTSSRSLQERLFRFMKGE